MSQPEISRRCLSCGASVRALARFCPQCGATMKEGATPAPAAKQTADADRAAAASEHAPAPEAPSRREVASAFETWREDARPPGDDDGREPNSAAPLPASGPGGGPGAAQSEA